MQHGKEQEGGGHQKAATDTASGGEVTLHDSWIGPRFLYNITECAHNQETPMPKTIGLRSISQNEAKFVALLKYIGRSIAKKVNTKNKRWAGKHKIVFTVNGAGEVRKAALYMEQKALQ